MSSDTSGSTAGKKEEAFKLRLSGHSYRQIQSALGIASRGTLSYWFKDLVLTPEAEKRLAKYTAKATLVGFTGFNKGRTRRIFEEDMVAYTIGKEFVGTLSERELILVGAALYWGEGTKSGGVKNTPRLVFTNSDPKMIKVFMHFALHGLRIPKDKISGELHLYEGIDSDVAKKYWSKVTGISTERFWFTYLLSRASQQKRPSTRLPYGTLAIRIPGRLYFSRIKGMMEGLYDACQ